METINNMATGVSKAIFGTNETGEEPISGVAGNTSNGEPYDAGNIGTGSWHAICSHKPHAAE